MEGHTDLGHSEAMERERRAAEESPSLSVRSAAGERAYGLVMANMFFP